MYTNKSIYMNAEIAAVQSSIQR